MLVVEAPLSRSLSRGTRGRSSVGRRRWIVQPFGLPPFGELSVLVWKGALVTVLLEGSELKP